MTSDQARDLKAQLEAACADARRLSSGLDASALVRNPSSGGWGIAENLQHLILTADAMIPLIEGALKELEGAAKKAVGPSGLGLMGWLLVTALEPPPRLKSRTTKRFEPVSVTDPLSLTERFIERNATLEALVARATGLATSTVTVASPFNGKVKYNLYAAFRIVLAHARRHLWQAAHASVV